MRQAKLCPIPRATCSGCSPSWSERCCPWGWCSGRWLSPEVPVVVISGYSQDGDAGELARAPGTAFVQKPFSSAALVYELGRLLKRGATR